MILRRLLIACEWETKKIYTEQDYRRANFLFTLHFVSAEITSYSPIAPSLNGPLHVDLFVNDYSRNGIFRTNIAPFYRVNGSNNELQQTSDKTRNISFVIPPVE